jgi:MHS family shikimate/dehydroshikimate transporter-like MFS transporter
VLVVLGLVVRRAVAESPAFTQLRQARAQAAQPLLEVLRHHPRPVLLAAGSRCAEIGFLNIATTFIVGYATQALGMPRPAVLASAILVTVFVLIGIPAFGALSDRHGRRSVYMAGAVAGTLLALPAMWLTELGHVGALTLGMLVVVIGPTVMFGPQATFFAELFRTRVRYSGSSLGFQLGSVLAGGFSPLIAASLAAAYGSLLPVGLFMIGLGLVTIGCTRALAGDAQLTRVVDVPILAGGNG